MTKPTRPGRPISRWTAGLALALAVGISTASTARADTSAITAALDSLFDLYASEVALTRSPGVGLGPAAETALDEQVAERLQAARPVLVQRLRLLTDTRLITVVDSVLASYSTLVDPRGTGSRPPLRGLVSGAAEGLIALARWGDLPTTRAVAPVANVVAAMDLVVTSRRHRREVASGVMPRPLDEEVRTIVARRARELVQLDHDLVGVEQFEAGSVASTRSGKKLSGFEDDFAVLTARHALRRMVALGHDQASDPRRGTGRIVSVP